MALHQKLDNLDEMERFPKRHKLPKLTKKMKT